MVESVGAHGVTLEINADEAQGAAEAMCEGRRVEILLEPGANDQAAHDQFVAQIETVLPKSLSFRSYNLDVERDTFGYAILARDVWEQLDRDAPMLVAEHFRPLKTG